MLQYSQSVQRKLWRYFEALPAKMGGPGVSSASSSALLAFFESAFGARDFLKTMFSETFEDDSFTKPLGKSWVWRLNRKIISIEDLTCQRYNYPSYNTWKGWPTFENFQRSSRQIWVTVTERCFLRKPKTATWQSVASDPIWFTSRCQHPRCAYVPLWEKRWTGRFARSSLTKSAGSFSPQANITFPKKRTLRSLDLPSMLKLRRLYRTDGKCSLEMKCYHDFSRSWLVWDVPVVML